MRNRTAEGPFLRSKVKPLSVKKSECFLVLMRNLTAGEQQGKWQPISTNGFRVVCPSRLEACECVWMVGGALYPRPRHLASATEDADFAYLRWLLDHHFRIVPHTAGGAMEVWFSDFIRGWYPAAEDIPGATAPIPDNARAMAEAALRFNWEGR